ncbi:MAG: putative metalloprotease [Frankiales bacterium]|nr:putative metalloprotease [Frankiales bacterium]
MPRLLQPRWLVRHLLLLVAVTGCYLGASWQLHRALARHSFLNWSYTVEWTLFGLFALLCWGWFLRDEVRPHEPEEEAPVTSYQPVVVAVTDAEDPELAAYNRYLSELNNT